MKKPNDVKRRNGHGMSDGFFFRFRGLIHRTTKEKVAEQEQIDLKMAKLGPDAAKPLSVAINRVVQRMQR